MLKNPLLQGQEMAALPQLQPGCPAGGWPDLGLDLHLRARSGVYGVPALQPSSSLP